MSLQETFFSLCLLCVTLMLMINVSLVAGQIRPVQRLMQPYSGSKLTMSPGLSFPSVQMSTIESAFNMRMPISIQFPTAAEAAQTFILQVAGMPGPRNNKESTSRDTNSRAMHARVNSRAKFYETIENVHETLGKTCLMRAICEVAEVPFVASSTGFLGEILDILLSSSPLIDKSGTLSEYLKAEKVGRESLIKGNDGCKKRYKECPFSLFKVMQIANEVL